MTNPTDLQNLIGRTAVDSEGNKIGKVGQIYLDDQSGEPVWVTLQTGLFGTKENFAPLAGSRSEGDNLVLAVPKDLVKDAPSVDADGHTNDDENDALYQHYQGYLAGGHGVATGGVQGQYSGTGGADYARTEYSDSSAGVSGGVRSEGHDTSGPNTDDAMTRSEEQVRIGTQNVESGRARLRKYIVTENVTQTVPVSHEEVRIEREPITDANRGAALSGADLSEEEHEVTLHAEQPVVQKETVPVERVRLGTETVTENQEVTETVRKERIEGDEGVEGVRGSGVRGDETR